MSAAAPLEGVRVVDLTGYVAGPYATMVLADLGAQVIKVERPGGEVYRRQGPVFAPGGESASFLTLNRGKSSAVLDLRSEEGRTALGGLLDEADLLVENGTPGAMERLGLGFADLHGRHPRLVYVSISGFGAVGPDAARGGYDLVLQAESGLLSMTGHPGQAPAKIPIAALDFGSGLYAALGAVAALRERDRTGLGSHVTTSLLECAMAWLSMHVVTYRLGGDEPSPEGTRSPFFAPYEAYRTEDGHLVVVGTGGDDAWGRLCGALGLDDGARGPALRRQLGPGRERRGAARADRGRDGRRSHGALGRGPRRGGRGVRAGSGGGGCARDPAGGGARHRRRAGPPHGRADPERGPPDQLRRGPGGLAAAAAAPG